MRRAIPGIGFTVLLACGAAEPEVPATGARIEAPPNVERRVSRTTAPSHRPKPTDPWIRLAGDVLARYELHGGLVAEDFVVGTGTEAVEGGEIAVHYGAYLEDGTQFDSSRARGEFKRLTLGKTPALEAWTVGIVGTRVGGRRRLTVPPALGYGTRKAGKVPPGSILILEFELVEAHPAVAGPRPLDAFAGSPVDTRVDQDGLEVYDLELGTGSSPSDGAAIVLHYQGELDDGTVFDTTHRDGMPKTLPFGRLPMVPGWDRGIAGMKVGGLRKIVIPPALGYGDQQVGKIPPNAGLTFYVELMAIREPPAR